MQLHLLIPVPSVFLNGVVFARLELALLHILVAAKRVDVAAFDRNRCEEGFFLEHRTPVDYVLVHVLKAVIAHAS